MDLKTITNPQAKALLTQFFLDREINRAVYEKIPEEKFDFRMVDRPERKSDSPRESLGHQIGIQQDYMAGVTSGTLVFRSGDDKQLKSLTKTKLLQKLQSVDQKLIELLSDPSIGNKKVKVPWSESPITAISSLWGLDSHEILHTGWNLAVMDHLEIERFELYKRWG